MVYLVAGFILELALLLQKIIYIGIFLSCIFLFLFANEVHFEVDRKILVWGYVTIGFVLIFVMAAFNLSDIILFLPDYPVLLVKFEFSLCVVGYLFPTFFTVLIMARRAARKINDPIFKVGYIFISWG